MRIKLIFFLFFSGSVLQAAAQTDEKGSSGETETTASRPAADPVKPSKTLYGQASYYADKFNGRKTANGEVYDSSKMTAACNVLPLGTWIRVTNLRNKRSVIVRTNDRLHPRMKRIVDLSRSAAEKLGYINRGLTQVKVEVIGVRKPPADVLAQQ
jgi:rare lipoprotein A